MSGVQTGPSMPSLRILAIPAVCCLIAFLGYYSQWIFNSSPALDPGPLATSESVAFNILLACLWWTYYKACTVDPGRYVFPPPSEAEAESESKRDLHSPSENARRPRPRPRPSTTAQQRWCKKCRAPKPPRAHHCRHCGRCVPKMDHHCPWTYNCVSLQTFPHFLRFLAYANISLWTLGWFLFARARAIWAARNLPAYLGPTLQQLVALAVLSLIWAGTTLALSIMFAVTLRGWALNTTMIESWEMERHEAVLERWGIEEEEDDDDDRPEDEHEDGGSRGRGRSINGRKSRKHWDGDDLPPLERVEFPYDLGIFANLAQAMGTRNPLLWLFPLASGPHVAAHDGRAGTTGTGWAFEENGFNDRPGMWPPPDPDKLRRIRAGGWPAAVQGTRFTRDDGLTPAEARAAFARRQEVDMVRRQQAQLAGRSGIIAELEELDGLEELDRHQVGGGGEDDSVEEGMDGKPGWTNSDGDRLQDYGVDEEAEEEELIPVGQEDENVPLAELLRRRKVVGSDGNG